MTEQTNNNKRPKKHTKFCNNCVMEGCLKDRFCADEVVGPDFCQCRKHHK